MNKCWITTRLWYYKLKERICIKPTAGMYFIEACTLSRTVSTLEVAVSLHNGFQLISSWKRCRRWENCFRSILYLRLLSGQRKRTTTTERISTAVFPSSSQHPRRRRGRISVPVRWKDEAAGPGPPTVVRLGVALRTPRLYHPNLPLFHRPGLSIPCGQTTSVKRGRKSSWIVTWRHEVKANFRVQAPLGRMPWPYLGNCLDCGATCATGDLWNWNDRPWGYGCLSQRQGARPQ